MKNLLIVLPMMFLLSSCSAGNNLVNNQQQENQKVVDLSTQNEAPTKSSQQWNATQKLKNSDGEEETAKEPDFIGIVPSRIEIPSLEVNATVNSQGLNKKGQMEVPNNGKDVGWYQLGAKPGARGNAVIAGHVDDYNGPAVFFYLKNLKPGDVVHIYGEENEKVSFQVERIVSYKKEEAPIREIFGPSQQARLNLITCTGLYNRKNNEHEKRLVVYTKRIDS